MTQLFLSIYLFCLYWKGYFVPEKLTLYKHRRKLENNRRSEFFNIDVHRESMQNYLRSNKHLGIEKKRYDCTRTVI